MYLEKINQPDDVKQLNMEQLKALAAEIREVLIRKLSIHGGHFGSNLGMVEATIALHYVFDSPADKMVFDVSHQTYCHKMLTGRKDAFLDEDKYDDVTGFSNPGESEHDFFTIGHTSTAISLASGLVKARDLKGEQGNVVAVIGDGSLSGGEALEGLDYAYELGSNFIIVVNDNQMSIAENYGGIYQNLKLLRETEGSCECNLFRAMGLDYLFVKDGNDLEELIAAFEKVKDTTRPIVVHICTQKGKGYEIAEQNQENWHWSSPFDIATGKPLSSGGGESFASVTAEYLLKKMKADRKVAVITSGTPTAIGFTKAKRQEAGRQFLDVGIAEEHAVALASGIAAGGGKPVYGVHSSFLQRTYDQLSQDLCINKNPATILVCTASIYGMKDITHLGIFDIPMISNIPNLVYLAPTNKEEYLAMLEWSIEQTEYPVAIRIPGGDMISAGNTISKDFSRLNQYQVTQQGSKAAILALGTFYRLGECVAKELRENYNIVPTLINPVYITGMDTVCLEQLKQNHEVVITLEDGVLDGGFGEKIAGFYADSNVKVRNYGYKKEFLDRYNVSQVLEANRLTTAQITEDIRSMLGD